MKKLNKILIAIILITGSFLVGFAQQDEKKPKKPNPPTIEVRPKETPKPSPTPKNPNLIIGSLESKAIITE